MYPEPIIEQGLKDRGSSHKYKYVNPFLILGKLEIKLYVCIMGNYNTYKSCIGIYAITCSDNKKVYIGSSKSIKARWIVHRCNLKKDAHDNLHLQRAYNKYGVDSFVYTILEKCQLDELISKETEWIDRFKSRDPEYGFNIMLPGEYPVKEVNQNRRIIEKYYCISSTIKDLLTRKEIVSRLSIPDSKLGDVITYWKNYNGDKLKGRKSWKGWIFVAQKDYNSSFDYLGALSIRKQFGVKKTYDKNRYARDRYARQKDLRNP